MNKVLTIVPLYNKEKYLSKCIESILQQTHTEIELVIVDDCSTDSSYQIAKSYEHLDNVTVLQNKENRGCYYSRNRGLEYFKDKEWDYFTTHDPDDYSLPTRFEIVLNQFKQNPHKKGLLTTYHRKDTTNPNWFHIRPSEGIAFYKREIFENLGYFDNTRFAGDTEYVSRADHFYCNFLKEPHWLGTNKEELYIAYVDGTNLTKTVKANERAQYWGKAKAKINALTLAREHYKEFSI